MGKMAERLLLCLCALPKPVEFCTVAATHTRRAQSTRVLSISSEHRLLYEVCEVRRHLTNSRGIKLLKTLQEAHVLTRCEVERNAFTAEAARATDSVDVKLA